MTLTRNPLRALVAATLALIAVVVISSPSDTYAGTFDPQLTVCLDDLSTVDPNPGTDGDPEECDGDNSPEVASSFVSSFGIGDEDVNFAAVVSYIPPDWGIVGGNDIPIGADVGYLDAAATLGLIGSACNQVLPVHFDFKNSSIDLSDTVIFTDDEEDDDATAEFAETDEATGEYMSVVKYPEFLLRVLDDEDGNPLQPLRRSSGVAIVAGIPVLLQFLIFPPGTVINEDLPSEPEKGWPSVTVLQNAGDPDIVPQPGPITDFCSPLSTTNVTLGETPEGDPLFITPKAGTHTFTTVSFGQRDADNDGYENSLDTCPFDVNAGNPKVTLEGDLDGDGLDAACDPNDDPATGGTNSDEDGDGYLNRQDNCPLVANGQQDESNQADADLDQIGDACDPEPDVADGDLSYSELTVDIEIGDAAGPGGAPDCVTAVGVACLQAGETQDNGNGNGDDGGSDTGLIIGIVVGVIAAVVILGGGAALLMRRRNGAA
ncbi:MAG TPA: thrombospondin type 3 repeat-containing protein [Dehalococcoidia bacterium]|nr:thrombospondin type 3 repeat-containing protein [Dehalococcoidia bacterium]